MFKTLLRFKDSNKLLRQTILDKAIKCNNKRLATKNIPKLLKIEHEAETSNAKKYTNPFANKSANFLVDKPISATTHIAGSNEEKQKNLFNNDNPEKFHEHLETHSMNDDRTPEEREKMLKVLKLEVDIAHQEGRRVPPVEQLLEHHWDYIITLPTKSQRIKYYAYLWQISMKKEARTRKKEERSQEVLKHKEELRTQREQEPHILYGLGQTSFFLRIYDTTINHWQNNRLTRAMQFAPKIALDCSYDCHMNRREAINASKQLMLCFAENRMHDDPFDLHYCNVNMNTICMQSLKRYIPTMHNADFPMNVHEKCFTEIFPREQIVYLTPHCRNDLEEYNADDVYIIGAMVDTVNNDPLSLAKAKKLGLRMARLPLDRYLQWGAGSGKSLTLNQMVNILLDLKSTGDWMKSLSHVPRRKVVDYELEAVQQKKFMDKRAQKLNVRIDRLLIDEDEEQDTQRATHKTRSYKTDHTFHLDTWASKKKKKF